MGRVGRRHLGSGLTSIVTSNPPLKYEVIIYWSESDSAFIAEIPELSGCAADGPTPQAALDTVEMIAGEWIDTANELGRLVPEPRGRFSFA